MVDYHPRDAADNMANFVTTILGAIIAIRQGHYLNRIIHHSLRSRI